MCFIFIFISVILIQITFSHFHDTFHEPGISNSIHTFTRTTISGFVFPSNPLEKYKYSILYTNLSNQILAPLPGKVEVNFWFSFSNRVLKTFLFLVYIFYKNIKSKKSKTLLLKCFQKSKNEITSSLSRECCKPFRKNNKRDREIIRIRITLLLQPTKRGIRRSWH